MVPMTHLSARRRNEWDLSCVTPLVQESCWCENPLSHLSPWEPFPIESKAEKGVSAQQGALFHASRMCHGPNVILTVTFPLQA